MGYYYEQRPPDKDDTPKPGCLDVLVITRVVLAVLFWPMAGIMGVVVAVAITFYLYALEPWLALIPVALGAVLVYLLARWDQRRSTPDELRKD